MFKNIFKSKKEVATTAKVEKLNINELKNVIGGGSGAAAPDAGTTPTPDPSDRKHGAVVSADFTF